MTVYVFDGTMDGLLSAVFDAYALKEQPEELLKSCRRCSMRMP